MTDEDWQSPQGRQQLRKSSVAHVDLSDVECRALLLAVDAARGDASPAQIEAALELQGRPDLKTALVRARAKVKDALEKFSREDKRGKKP